MTCVYVTDYHALESTSQSNRSGPVFMCSLCPDNISFELNDLWPRQTVFGMMVHLDSLGHVRRSRSLSQVKIHGHVAKVIGATSS